MYDPYRTNYNQQPQLFEDTSETNTGGGYNFHEQNYMNNEYKERPTYPQNSGYGPQGATIPGAQFMQDPLVTNMAMQYGQNLMGHGKQFVDSKLETIMSASKIKYYFAVDTKYVMKKLKLIFFPFIHADWSLRYNSESDEPVQPRYDVNAPDLYIPCMAFITYILLAGLCLGLQSVFSPDVLGMQASGAVVWLLLELGIIVLAFHLTGMQYKMHAVHLLALISYKYVGMIAALLAGVALQSFGYVCVLGYAALCSVVFMFRTLRCQVQGNVESMHGYSTGTKRRFYLLILISGLQPFMMWWLTRQLIAPSITTD